MNDSLFLLGGETELHSVNKHRKDWTVVYTTFTSVNKALCSDLELPVTSSSPLSCFCFFVFFFMIKSHCSSV